MYVKDIFSHKGAYSRFKEFLIKYNLIEKWYDYENAKIKRALLEWCEDSGLQVSDDL